MRVHSEDGRVTADAGGQVQSQSKVESAPGLDSSPKLRTESNLPAEEAPLRHAKRTGSTIERELREMVTNVAHMIDKAKVVPRKRKCRCLLSPLLKLSLFRDVTELADRSRSKDIGIIDLADLEEDMTFPAIALKVDSFLEARLQRRAAPALNAVADTEPDTARVPDSARVVDTDPAARRETREEAADKKEHADCLLEEAEGLLARWVWWHWLNSLCLLLLALAAAYLLTLFQRLGSNSSLFLAVAAVFLIGVVGVFLVNTWSDNCSRVKLGLYCVTKHLFSAKVSRLDSYVLESQAFRRILSYLYSDAVENYTRPANKRGQLWGYVLLAGLLGASLFLGYGRATCAVFLATLALKFLADWAFSCRETAVAHFYNKSHFARKNILHDLLRYFKEVSLTCMTDLMVKRLLFRKIEEEQNHSRLARLQKLRETVVEATPPLFFFALFAFDAVCAGLGYERFSPRAELSQLCVLVVVASAAAKVRFVPGEFSARRAHCAQSQALLETFLALPEAALDPDDASLRLVRTREPGEVLIEHQEIKGRTYRVFQPGHSHLLFESFGLSYHDYVSSLDKESIYLLDGDGSDKFTSGNIGAGSIANPGVFHSPENHSKAALSRSLRELVEGDPNMRAHDSLRDYFHKSDQIEEFESEFSSKDFSECSDGGGGQIKLRVKAGEKLMIFSPLGDFRPIRLLISSLLRECIPRENRILVKGRISYVNLSKPYFLVGKTIKDNILFGDPYSSSRYAQVLNILKFAMFRFPGEDMMVVSDSGSNLSAIEKNLLLLARLVYKDSDVYIIENYLSFRRSFSLATYPRVFDGFLQHKTVLFVTNDRAIESLVTKVLNINKGTLNVMKNGQLQTENLSQSESKKKPWEKEGGKERTMMYSNARDCIFLSSNDFKHELRVVQEFERKKKHLQDVFKTINPYEQMIYGVYLLSQKIQHGDLLFNPFATRFPTSLCIFQEVFLMSDKIVLVIIWTLIAIIRLVFYFCLFSYLAKLHPLPDQTDVTDTTSQKQSFFVSYDNTLKRFQISLRESHSEFTCILVLSLALAYSILVALQNAIFVKKSRKYADKLHDLLVQKLINLTPMQFEKFKREMVFELFTSCLSKIERKQFRVVGLQMQALVDGCVHIVAATVLFPVVSTAIGVLAFVLCRAAYSKVKKCHFDVLREYFERKMRVKLFFAHHLQGIVMYRVLQCKTDLIGILNSIVGNERKLYWHVHETIPRWLSTRVRLILLILFFVNLIILFLARDWIPLNIQILECFMMFCVCYNIDSYFDLTMQLDKNIPNLILIKSFLAATSHGEESLAISSSHTPWMRQELYGNITIAFKNVTLMNFQRPILREVSFTLKSCLTYALVGLDQLSKQSIFNLVMGYHVESNDGTFYGKVMARDSESKRTFKSIQNFRQHYFYLSQEPLFFEGTIRDNLFSHDSVSTDFSEEYVILLLDLFGIGNVLDRNGGRRKSKSYQKSPSQRKQHASQDLQVEDNLGSPSKKKEERRRSSQGNTVLPAEMLRELVLPSINNLANSQGGNQGTKNVAVHQREKDPSGSAQGSAKMDESEQNKGKKKSKILNIGPINYNMKPEDSSSNKDGNRIKPDPKNILIPEVIRKDRTVSFKNSAEKGTRLLMQVLKVDNQIKAL